MSQLALFEFEAAPAPPEAVELPPWFRRQVPDCVCEQFACSNPCVADHGWIAGCRNCACTATTLPPEAVELAFPVEFADGCGIWVELRSHYFAATVIQDGESEQGSKVWSPHVEMRGACSETGYRSHIGALNTDPGPGGWVGWGMAVAGEAHREWCCPAKKGRKR